MSSCSKAPRGLFVLLRTDGIFTVNALSPSSSLRQYPYHYAIRAGQNLPDKEFRYLRTVIVTAAVHWGFSSKLSLLPLTFQHRAGVSPYTSTFVLAQTCVFGKQLHGLLSCGPLTVSTTIRVRTSEQITNVQQKLMLKSEPMGSAFFLICLEEKYSNLYRHMSRSYKLDTYSVVFKKKTGISCSKHCGKHSEGADLIPKLRSLICRVP
jgi:hypothetical protein